MRDRRKTLARIDGWVLLFIRFSKRVLLWPILYTIAWGATLWSLTHSDRIPAFSKNGLDQSERVEQLFYLLGTAGAMAILLLGFLSAGRAIYGDWRVEERALRFNRFFAFSLAAPFLAALTLPGVESSRPIHTLFFIVCATLSLMPTVAFLWEGLHGVSAAETPGQPARLRTLGVIVAVGGLFAAYSVWFSHLAINNHHALQTRLLDLGIYDNIFYHSSHGNFLGSNFIPTNNHANAHFDAILVLLSPLYYIYPRAELILVLQAVWCGAGVIPAYLLGRHHLGSRWAGMTMAVAWALYPALHGANLYEFHSLTLLAMPMMWMLYLLTAGKLRAFFILLPFVLLIREDAPLLIACVAFAGILTRDPRLVRAGWITIGVAGLYFISIKTLIMGSADPLGGEYGFAWYYTDMIPHHLGLGDLVISLLTNPTFAVDLALREAKLVYLLELLVPLAFLPIFAKHWRFATAFGLFYILLATREPVFSIHFQYSVMLFPVLIALTPIGLRCLRDGDLAKRMGLAKPQLVTILLASVLVSSLLMSWKFGGAVTNTSFRGGWARIPHTLTPAQEERYVKFRKLVEQVPPDASVTVTNTIGPHMSNRAEVWNYADKKQSEYLMIDTRDMKGWPRKHHRDRVAAGKLELLGTEGTFQLFRVKE
ncbi:MAG: DUF2079 domain-containing protein [Polyangiales bacterium]